MAVADEQVEADGAEGGAEPESPSPPNVPFDPSKIRVQTKSLPVVTLCNRLAHDEIRLGADYQRKAGIWSDTEQSLFVESLLLRLPVPACFMAELESDNFEVIDGVQRLTALYRFRVEPDRSKRLVLRGLEYLTHLVGKRWEDLGSLQRRLDEVEILAFVVSKDTPDDVKLNIFKRINKQGLPLSAQELRHAMNPGPVRRFLQERAEGLPFRTATMKKVRPDRMVDREFVARFLAFQLVGRDAYAKHHDFDSFLNEGMKLANKLSEPELETLGGRFDSIMELAHDLLGDWAFRWPGENRRKSPINRAVFDATVGALAALGPGDPERLRAAGPALAEAYLGLFDTNMVNAIKIATTDASRVETRFTAMAGFFRTWASERGTA